MMPTWILLLALLRGAIGLRSLSLDIPEKVYQGQDIRLWCNYDPEDDDIYSIIWYKDDVQFYQYLPFLIGFPKDSYPIPGIEVDLEKSNDASVYIRKVSGLTAGRFRCVVSTDEPTFITLSQEKAMAVVEGEEIEFRQIKETNLTHNIYSININQ